MKQCLFAYRYQRLTKKDMVAHGMSESMADMQWQMYSYIDEYGWVTFRLSVKPMPSTQVPLVAKDLDELSIWLTSSSHCVLSAESCTKHAYARTGGTTLSLMYGRSITSFVAF